MTKPLDRFIGMTLLSAEIASESAELRFSRCDFSAYSTYSSFPDFGSLVGQTVQSVVGSMDRLVIRFAFGEFFISLHPDDYRGPEAFCARFADGPWVVE